MKQHVVRAIKILDTEPGSIVAMTTLYGMYLLTMNVWWFVVPLCIFTVGAIVEIVRKDIVPRMAHCPLCGRGR